MATRMPLIITAVAGLVMTVLGVVLRGTPGLVAGLVGTIVVVAFFGIGNAAVGRVLAGNPQIAMTAALLVYVLQILALLVLLLLLRDATWLDGRWFGFTVFAGIIAWTLGQVIAFMRNRGLTVIPGSGPGHPDGPAEATGDSTSGDASAPPTTQ